MTIFGLTMTIGVIGISLVVIDQMSYENKRVVAQDAMDRCVVMTALAQNRINSGTATNFSASQLANECLSKSGAEDAASVSSQIVNQNSTIDVTLTNEFNFKSIGVPDDMDMPDTQDYKLTANFSQSIPNIEITIAIDLNEPDFLNDFKDQLKKFIRAVSAADTGGKISFNILPFAGDVNLSPYMISRFNTTNPTPFSPNGNRSCLVLPEETKHKIAIDMSQTYSWSWPVYFDGDYNQKTASNIVRPYFEYTPTPFFSGAQLNELQIPSLQQPSYATSPNTSPWGVCRYMTTANNPVLGIQPNRAGGSPSFNAINSYIDGLVANKYDVFAQSNNTTAMKWALALMDPSTRPLFSQLPNNGLSSPQVAGRPLDYGAEESYKILIFASNSLFFMSNGSLTTSQGSPNKRFASTVREIREGFLNGSEPPPEIWRTPASSDPNRSVRYSIRHSQAPGANQYWVTESGDVTDSIGFEGHWASEPFSYPGEGPAVRQTWKQIFESMSVDYLIERLYMYPLTKLSVLPNDSRYHYAALADKFTYISNESTRLRINFGRLCTEARTKGVIVYTILGDGVMDVSNSTPYASIRNMNAAAAREELKNCATSTMHSHLGNLTSRLKAAMLLIATSITQMSTQETSN